MLFSLKHSKTHIIYEIFGLKIKIKFTPKYLINYTCLFKNNIQIKKKHAIVFAMYNKKGIIEQNLINYLKELKKYSDCIFLISDSKIKSKEIEKIENLVDYVDFSRHGEYDFGSYKRGFLALKKMFFFNELEQITFCNDSCKYLGNSFEKYFSKCKNFDAYGLTINNYAFRLRKNGENMPMCRQPHIQSYFITLSKPVFKDKCFISFMKKIKHLKRKEEICIKYEVGLSELIQKKKFAINSYYPSFRWLKEPSGYYLNLDSPYEGERLLIKKGEGYKFNTLKNNESIYLVAQDSMVEKFYLALKKYSNFIFSIVNTVDRRHKLITILGIKIKWKRKNKK